MVKVQGKVGFHHHAVNFAFLFSIFILMQSTSYGAERPGLLMNASMAVAHDDNILRTREKISDTLFRLSPDIEYLLIYGKHEFLLDYQSNYLAYSDNDSFNYSSHDLSFTAAFEHSHRAKTEFGVSYEDTIEEPGTTNSVTNANLDEFNKFSRKSAFGKYYYGTRQSIGQIVLSLKRADKDFRNNQQTFRNEDSWQLKSVFFYRTAPKTRLFIETAWINYDYENMASSQNNDTLTYLVGVEWSATTNTSGSFKVGYETKDYDDSNSVSGLSYLLDMNWQPLTSTKLILKAQREAKTSAELGIRDVISTSFSLGVVNELTDRTIASAEFYRSNDEIASSTDRTDKITNYKFGVNHSIQKWLNIGLNYRYKERDSDISIFNFNANIIELSLTTTFK